LRAFCSIILPTRWNRQRVVPCTRKSGGSDMIFRCHIYTYRVSNNYLASQDGDLIFKIVKRQVFFCADMYSFAIDAIV
jgi:hypothetical protein